jgi:hypothetical protein
MHTAITSLPAVESSIIAESPPPSTSVPVVDFKYTADLVLGQPDLITNLAGVFGYSTGFSSSNVGVSFSNGKLLLTDSISSRVLIWNSIPSVNTDRPDIAIGQKDISSTVSNLTSSYYLSGPSFVIESGGKLFVADTSNNRVLIYNSIPTSNFKSADVVIGQPSFTDNIANNGGVSATSLSSPRSIAIAGSKLLIADSGNNRILIFNTIPTVNGAAADVVLGQNNFSGSSANAGGLVSASSLSGLYSIASDGIRLLVADRSNNRALIWTSIPTVNAAPADFVLGQSLFDSAGLGVGASRLSGPQGIAFDGTKLFISDSGDHRVLIWNGLPSSNNQPADVVIGQPDMITYTSGLTAKKMNTPASIYSNGTNLAVNDFTNSRVLIYTSIPTSNDSAANVVMGQHNYTANYWGNPGSGAVATTIRRAREARVLTANRFAITDYFNHRILIYNSMPTINQQVPDVVIGQVDFVSSVSGVTATNMSKPNSVATDGTKLVLADFGNYRVLIYNSIPTVNGAAADVVLGQTTLTARVLNSGGPSASSMAWPYHVEICDGRLIVTDASNNRVMIYNSIPTANNALADIIIGQPNINAITANTGGTSAATMSAPSSALCVDNKLIVADSGNNRMLIWNNFPAVTGQAADVVLGQIDFTTTLANAGGISAATFFGPAASAMVGSKFFVSDYANKRILVWNSLPTSNGTPANYVIGQTNFTEDISNNGGVNANSIGAPFFLTSIDKYLFVADERNNRILRFPIE